MELEHQYEQKLEKYREERRRLEKELEQLQRESTLPVPRRSQKLIDLETQIAEYRGRIRHQEMQLSEPMPRFDDSIVQQRDITKRHLAEMCRQRLSVVRHPQLDALDGRYLKEFDKLEYVRKAYFPLFNEKQSTLLGFSQAEDCGLRYQLQDQMEESYKLQTVNQQLRVSIDRLESELQRLEQELLQQ